MPKLMKMWSKRILFKWRSLFLVAFLGMAGPVIGQQSRRTELGFRNDNDAYLMIKQDQYYTNGIHFFMRKAVDTSRLSDRWNKKIWSLSLGQKIFNAYKGDIRDIREIDRPITGYLFAEARLNWYTDSEE